MIQGGFCHLDLDVSTLYAKKVSLMRRKCLGFLGCLRRASGLQRVSRLVRATLSFSKKQTNQIGAIKYFLSQYNFELAKA